MSFEEELRARLHDLADREDEWADPVPAARQGRVEAADPPPVAHPDRPRGPRRWTRALAVAAVLVALVVGVGIGVGVVRHGAGSSSSATGEAGRAAGGAAAGTASGPRGSSSRDVAVGPGDTIPGPGATVCGASPTSGGALGTLARVDVGAVGPLTSGGHVDVPVTLTFTGTGPTVGLHAAQAVLVRAGEVVGGSTGASSFALQQVVVTPGSRTDVVTLPATGCDGQPLARGTYDLVVAYGYSTGGDSASLASAPVEVQVR